VSENDRDGQRKENEKNSKDETGDTMPLVFSGATDLCWTMATVARPGADLQVRFVDRKRRKA
jgi:hypothetical protein